MNSNVLKSEPGLSGEFDLFWVTSLEEETQHCFALIGGDVDENNPLLRQSISNLLKAGMTATTVSKLMGCSYNLVRNIKTRTLVWEGRITSLRQGATIPARLILSIFFMQYVLLVGASGSGKVDRKSLLHAWRLTCEIVVASKINCLPGFKVNQLILENFFDIAFIWSMGGKTDLGTKRTSAHNFRLDYCHICNRFYWKALSPFSATFCCFCQYRTVIDKSKEAIARQEAAEMAHNLMARTQQDIKDSIQVRKKD